MKASWPWSASVQAASRQESPSQLRRRIPLQDPLADSGAATARRQGAQDLINASESKQQNSLLVSSAATLLRSYGTTKELLKARLLHARLCRYGLDVSSTFLSNCLTQTYGNLGCLAEAQAVFNATLEPSLYSFNIMLKVLSRHDRPDAARTLFERIPCPDSYSWTMLITAYGQSGCVEDAMHLFQRMPHKNVIAWTATIAVHSQNGHGQEALELFCKMQMQGVLANNVTFTCALDACAINEALETGQNIHATILMQNCTIDIALVTSLINMYGKCGSLPEAAKCFTLFTFQSVAPWTAMMSALAQHNHSMEAFHMLFRMQFQGIKPDKIAFVCALDACASMEMVEAGQLVHISILDFGLDEDRYIGNALVKMYGNFCRVDDAQVVFSRSSHQDIVSWTGMMGAFALSEKVKERLVLFAQMLLEGAALDKIVLLCAVDTCASLPSLEKGLEIHTIILNSGHDQDVDVGNTLVNMYGKCGSLHHTLQAFFKLPRRDIFSWNTLIAAHVQNGGEEQALNFFHQMGHEGCKADDITFNLILTACSHAGWIDMGKCFCYFFMNDEGASHNRDSYICMVDLLGRGGLLDEAEYVVHNAASEKGALAWLCLLGASKVHNDVERALRAGYHCMELDPENPTAYVLLSNMCITTGEQMYAVAAYNFLYKSQ